MSEKLIKNMSIGVIIYAIAYMVLTCLYCGPRILAEYTMLDVSHLTENFEFPLEIFSWGLLAICAGYSGVDVGFGKNKVAAQNQGEIRKDKVLQVIILLILILLESTIFNLFIGHDFVRFDEFSKQVFKGIKLPLEGISTALVSTIVIYITGNQIAMTKESKDSSKENSEDEPAKQ